MSQHAMKLMVIVVESVLMERVLADLKRLGATGYTITDARGGGSRGLRVGEVPGDNKRIEVLMDDETAGTMLELLSERYFPSYAIAAWVSDVVVVREGKYLGR
ncbi:MAG: transcriptional regulator [Thermoanaerobaculia bacterium]